jgi:hypothetical protein
MSHPSHHEVATVDFPPCSLSADEVEPRSQPPVSDSALLEVYQLSRTSPAVLHTYSNILLVVKAVKMGRAGIVRTEKPRYKSTAYKNT